MVRTIEKPSQWRPALTSLEQTHSRMSVAIAIMNYSSSLDCRTDLAIGAENSIPICLSIDGGACH